MSTPKESGDALKEMFEACSNQEIEAIEPLLSKAAKNGKYILCPRLLTHIAENNIALKNNLTYRALKYLKTIYKNEFGDIDPSLITLESALVPDGTNHRRMSRATAAAASATASKTYETTEILLFEKELFAYRNGTISEFELKKIITRKMKAANGEESVQYLQELSRAGITPDAILVTSAITSCLKFREYRYVQILEGFATTIERDRHLNLKILMLQRAAFSRS